MKNIITLTTSFLVLAASLFGQQTFFAGTDFVADVPEYVIGFTLTDNASSIDVVGTDSPGNAISLWFNSTVDMSALTTQNSFFTFTINGGSTATSSFSTSVFDSTFGAEALLSGYNFGDPTAEAGPLGSTSVDLTDVQNFVLNTGGIGDAVNISIESFTIVPEPSTYALLAGFAAFVFVAIRRRK